MSEFNLRGEDFIVVGGAGYIGAHVCKMVSERGGNPIVFDNFSAGHKHAVKWGPFINVDCQDRKALDAAFAQYPDSRTVIHLASSIEVGLGETDPTGFYHNNVVGALNLLDAMHKAKCDRFIFSSTCATYGHSEVMPLTEDRVQNPFSVYGKTKLAIEHMIQSYHKAYGLNYVTLRYFNAAGADANAEIGEEHDPETHLIPNALKAIAGLGPAMKLFGTDYDTKDGTCIRDYIHVNDIALAHIKALQAFEAGLTQAEVNIGTGKGVSNLEVLKAIQKVTGKPVPYKVAPRRQGDVTRLYADATLAKTVLGFSPEYSELDNIITTAWNFHRKIWKL